MGTIVRGSLQLVTNTHLETPLAKLSPERHHKFPVRMPPSKKSAAVQPQVLVVDEEYGPSTYAAYTVAYTVDNALDEDAQTFFGQIPGLHNAPYLKVLQQAGVPDYYAGLALTDLIRLFYTEMACAVQTNQYPVFRERIKPFADMIALGLYVSCAGECRYVMHKYLHAVIRLRNSVNRKRRKWFERTRTYKFAVRLGAGPDARTWFPGLGGQEADSKREQVGASVSAGWQDRIVNDRKGIESDFRIMARAFALSKAQKGYAGSAWAYGAETGRQYFAGEISAASFIDMTFDQVHNGAAILNKAWLASHYGGVLADWLYFKKHASPADLVKWAPNHIRELYGLAPTPFVLPSECLRFCNGPAVATHSPEYFWENSVAVPEERLSVLWNRKWYRLPFNPIDEYPANGYMHMISSVVAGDTQLRNACDLYFNQLYTPLYRESYRYRGAANDGHCAVPNCPYNTKKAELYKSLAVARKRFERAKTHHARRQGWAKTVTDAYYDLYPYDTKDMTIEIVDAESAYRAMTGHDIPESMSMSDLDNPDLLKINLE